MSQAGLEPICAGRFFVHTPTHRASVPPGTIAYEIDAGLAFGTGHHDTTAGCLAALDRLGQAGERFTNIADIGTGTGLLAFAALALWPDAHAIATDIDPISIDVTRDNARINRVPIGHGAGELLLAVADGMEHPLLVARAPFDLLIANILAGPLIEMAPAFAKSVAPGADRLEPGLAHRHPIILAQLLDCRGRAGGQRGERGKVGGGRLVGEISVDPPVVGGVGIGLVGDDYRRAVGEREQILAVGQRLGLGAGAVEGDAPAHLPVSFANRSSSALVRSAA
jgi:ribosomal protein L11 methyltransferase